MPGISGATRTPVLMPASRSAATASIRLRGLGVPGSVARHAFRSSVGIDRFAANFAFSSSFLNRSISRSSSGDLVSTEHGLRASSICSQTARVIPYLPSTHWYGSVFVPSATCSPFHDGRRSSARRTSGRLTLTTISRSKSSRGFRSRYAVGGTGKAEIACMGASSVRVDRPAEVGEVHRRDGVEGGARLDLVEIDADGLRGIEGADDGCALHSGEPVVAILLGSQVVPSHERMFAQGSADHLAPNARRPGGRSRRAVALRRRVV